MFTLPATEDTEMFLQGLRATPALENPQNTGQPSTEHQQDQGAFSGLQQAAGGSTGPHQHQKDDAGESLELQVPEQRLLNAA